MGAKNADRCRNGHMFFDVMFFVFFLLLIFLLNN